MTWTDNHGRRMRLWIPEEVGRDSPMRRSSWILLVDRTVGILEHEPIDIYANPTFLPDVIAKDYDKLWTEERMKKVVDRGGKQGQCGDRDQQPATSCPSATFIKHGEGGGLQVLVRDEQHRADRPVALRVRPAHGGGVQAGVAGFLCPWRVGSESGGSEARSVEGVSIAEEPQAFR